MDIRISQFVASVATVLALTAPSHSDDLAELMQTLNKLKGTTPLRVTTEINQKNLLKERAIQSEKKEHAQFEMKSSPTGFSVSFERNLVQDTQGTDNKEDQTSNTNIMDEFCLLRVPEVLNYASTLAQELQGITLVEKKSDKYDGIDCFLWRFESATDHRLPGFGFSMVRSRSLSLWVNRQGCPIASSMESRSEFKARTLIFKRTDVKSSSKRKQRYERCGDCLVLVFEEKQEQSSQGNEKTSRITTTTVRILEP